MTAILMCPVEERRVKSNKEREKEVHKRIAQKSTSRLLPSALGLIWDVLNANAAVRLAD